MKRIMMNRREALGIAGGMVMLIGILGGEPASTFASAQVELNQTLHFTDPDGMPIQLDPGIYEFSYSEGEQLHVSPAGKKPLTIHARPGDHSEPITQPKALVVEDEGDATVVWVMYLLPNGKGWEAMGSTTGIQSRGRLRLSKRKRNFSRVLRFRDRKKSSTATSKPKRPLPPAIPVPADCPPLAPWYIAEYPSGVTDPHAAPKGQETIDGFVTEILKSYQPGCWPIIGIVVIGLSDKSAGGIQVDDYISNKRAMEAKSALQRAFKARAATMSVPRGYPSPADIGFIVGGIGSRNLRPNDPPRDPWNRRVDLLGYTLPASVELQVNRRGGDYKQRPQPDAMACRVSCVGSAKCRAFTYKQPVPPQTEGQCFLKDRIPPPTRDPNAISGVVLPEYGR